MSEVTMIIVPNDAYGLLELMVSALKSTPEDGFTVPSAKFIRPWVQMAEKLLKEDREAGMAQAQEMAKNMQEYGTIDAPAEEPIGRVLTEAEMGIRDRRNGPVIWFATPPAGMDLYARPRKG